jgi:hypothetical protein
MICFELLSSINLYKLLCLTKGSCFFTLYCKNGVPMIKDMKIGLQVSFRSLIGLPLTLLLFITLIYTLSKGEY